MYVGHLLCSTHWGSDGNKTDALCFGSSCSSPGERSGWYTNKHISKRVSENESWYKENKNSAMWWRVIWKGSGCFRPGSWGVLSQEGTSIQHHPWKQVCLHNLKRLAPCSKIIKNSRGQWQSIKSVPGPLGTAVQVCCTWSHPCLQDRAASARVGPNQARGRTRNEAMWQGAAWGRTSTRWRGRRVQMLQYWWARN